MKITTLASGSKGNCTLVQTDKTNILIDAGITLQEIEAKLQFLGVDPKSISGILVTHEHGDHIKSVGAFSRKYGTKIYANYEEWAVLLSKIGKVNVENRMSFVQNEFMLNDIGVRAFELSHDSHTCFGYSIYNNGNKFSIATDLGYAPQSVINNLANSELIVLEANHDEKMLINNPKYSVSLKKRILSNSGHLNNNATSDVIEKLMNSNLKQVILGHLSEENNTPSLAYTQVKSNLARHGIEEGKNIFIDVSTQHEIGHTVELKNKN